MEESNQERKMQQTNETKLTEDRHQMGRIQKITKIKEKKTVDR